MPEDVSQFRGISVLQKEDGFEVWKERKQSKEAIKGKHQTVNHSASEF